MLSIVTSLFASPVKKYLSIGLGVMVVVCAFLFLLWDRAETKTELECTRTELVAVQTAYNSATAIIANLKADIITKDNALAERELAIHEINADREALRQRWQEAIRNEPDTRNWADTSLPDAVRSMLQ